jgi:hypothetical protein
MSDKLNGYALAKAWFAYAYENPEAFNATDHALYFWVIQCANMNGWKTKFSFGAKSAMEVLGIGAYNTYKKSFDKLVEHKFIKVVRKSPNHYQAAIISVSEIDILSDALRYTVIDTLTDILSDELSDANIKQETINNKHKTVKATPPPPLDIEPELLERYLKFQTWAAENAPRVLKMKEPLTATQLQNLLQVSSAVEVKSIFEDMHNYAELSKRVSAFKTARTWLERRKTNPIGKQPEPQQKSTYDRKWKGYDK